MFLSCSSVDISVAGGAGLSTVKVTVSLTVGSVCAAAFILNVRPSFVVSATVSLSPSSDTPAALPISDHVTAWLAFSGKTLAVRVCEPGPTEVSETVISTVSGAADFSPSFLQPAAHKVANMTAASMIVSNFFIFSSQKIFLPNIIPLARPRPCFP